MYLNLVIKKHLYCAVHFLSAREILGSFVSQYGILCASFIGTLGHVLINTHSHTRTLGHHVMQAYCRQDGICKLVSCGDFDYDEKQAHFFFGCGEFAYDADHPVSVARLNDAMRRELVNCP